MRSKIYTTPIVRNEVYYYTIPHEGVCHFPGKAGFCSTSPLVSAKQGLLLYGLRLSIRSEVQLMLPYAFNTTGGILLYFMGSEKKICKPMWNRTCEARSTLLSVRKSVRSLLLHDSMGFATFLAKGGNFPGKRLFYITPVISKITYNEWHFFVYNF